MWNAIFQFALLSILPLKHLGTGPPFILAYCPLDVVKKTLENTTQLAKMIVRFPLRRHVKARFKWANVSRIQETVSTDPIF